MRKLYFGKSPPKNVGKGNEEKRATVTGHRMFFDISSIKNVSFGGTKFWLLIVDDATDMCFSFFLKRKIETAQAIVNLIKDLKEKRGIMVKILRCDNAGENMSAAKLCQDEGLGINFEYTAPNTPQHSNGRVERKFTTLFGRIRSMLNGAKLTDSLRKGL
jgi:hypothetical protein